VKKSGKKLDNISNKNMTSFLKKIFFYLTFALLISSNSHSAEANAEAFVLKLTNEAKLIFNDKSLNLESRLKKLNNLSQSYLDLDALAGYTLGDYREKATDSEKDNFNKLFREYFIKNMSSKLNDFANQELKILDSKKINENNIIVSTKIFSKKDAQEINVNWRIYTKDSKLLARDLLVEGLSLARTQKEEFASIIANKGFAGLISALENFNKSN
jgi:phospholipid transport system substrate-binding protein